MQYPNTKEKDDQMGDFFLESCKYLANDFKRRRNFTREEIECIVSEGSQEEDDEIET